MFEKGSVNPYVPASISRRQFLYIYKIWPRLCLGGDHDEPSGHGVERSETSEVNPEKNFTLGNFYVSPRGVAETRCHKREPPKTKYRHTAIF